MVRAEVVMLINNLFASALLNLCDGDMVDEGKEEAKSDAGENRAAETSGLAEK
jgi:hypothetical protein